MRYLRTNTAVRLTVGPFLDKTDGITPETSLSTSDCHVTLMVDDANVPTLVVDADATASGGNNDMVHVTNDDAGFYDLELTAANLNYLGRAILAITNVAVHCPVFHEFMILPAMVYDSFVLGTDVMQADVTQLLGTAWLAPGTAGTPDVNAKLIGGTAQTGLDLGAAIPNLPTTDELDTALAGLNDLDAAGIRSAVGLGSANLDTQLAALPTTDELDTALAAADDAVLAAIADLAQSSDLSDMASDVISILADYARRTGDYATSDDIVSAQSALTALINNLPTTDELDTALAAADDAVLAAIADLAQSSDLSDVAGDVTTILADYARRTGDYATSDDVVSAQSALTALINNLPTTDELDTALAAADDAVLAAIADIAQSSDLDDVATNITTILADYARRTGDYATSDDIVSAQAALTSLINNLPTTDELDTALASADDAVLAAIAGLSFSSSDVWTQMTSDLTLANSIGKLLVDNVDGKISEISSGATTDIAAAVWNFPTSDTGTTDTMGGLTVEMLDAAVSSASGTSAADIRAAIGMASANLDTQLGNLPTTDELDTAISSLAASSDLEDIATDINTILADYARRTGDYATSDDIVSAQAALTTLINNLPTTDELDTALGDLAQTTDLAVIDANVDTILADYARRTGDYATTDETATILAAIAALPTTDETAAVLASIAALPTTDDLTMDLDAGDIASIASAVWASQTSDLSTSDSIGKLLVTDIDAKISSVSSLGTGSVSWTVTINDGSSALDGVDVWITTDAAGTNMIARGYTNASGQVTFMLDTGTYYCWKQLAGYTFTNPETLTVS